MIRDAVFAGSWYPGDPGQMNRVLDEYLAEAPVAPGAAYGVIAPHAGWIYSGRVAGSVYGCVDVPETAIVMSPNHTGLGSPRSIWPVGEWRIPGAGLEVNMELADLVREHAGLESDTLAHMREHSLEIQLPFIARRRPGVRIVPVCLGRLGYKEIEAIGRGVAAAIRAHGRDALLVASTDMSHHIPADRAGQLDAMAIERMEEFDPKGLFDTVRKHGITMCGVVPTTAVLVAARELGASGVKLVRYAHSGHVTGETREVVGYAGLVIG
jgi:AmmeMemoRadiSam system protein B